MSFAMFYIYITVWLILLVVHLVVLIIKNKETEIIDFGAIFGRMEFTQIANNFQI